MRAGIAIDNWKLPVFRKRLTDAGYEYTDGGPITGDTTLLRVETDDLPKLAKVVAACQAECAKQKGKPTSR
jgi:hypothetical protein